MTDQEVLFECARVRTKCAEKTSVGLWGQSRDSRKLPGVTGPARGWVGVFQLVSEPTLAVTRACAGQAPGHVGHGSALSCANMWNMCRHWTHRRVPRGEVPGLDVDRRGHRSSKGGRMWGGPGCYTLDRGFRLNGHKLNASDVLGTRLRKRIRQGAVAVVDYTSLTDD